MIQTLTYITNADQSIIEKFIKRTSAAGISTTIMNRSGKGTILEASWDDAVIAHKISLSKKENIGCPPKELTYEGKPVTCASVYSLRNKGISDARIAELLDVSESTITRRRKRHMKEGNFHADSKTRF